jgi:hypothetical protein
MKPPSEAWTGALGVAGAAVVLGALGACAPGSVGRALVVVGDDPESVGTGVWWPLGGV